MGKRTENNRKFRKRRASAFWRKDNVVRFDSKRKGKKRHMRSAILAATVFLLTVAVGIALFAFNAMRNPPPHAQPLPTQTNRSAPAVQKEVPTGGPRMALCDQSSARDYCVIDGDTIIYAGEKIRVADIDTPEVSSPQCQYEYELGMRATYRFRELLNEGAFSIERIGFRDEDQYGRKLRVLTRRGQSIGDILVSEGLARTWTGQREPWC